MPLTPEEDKFLERFYYMYRQKEGKEPPVDLAKRLLDDFRKKQPQKPESFWQKVGTAAGVGAKTGMQAYVGLGGALIEAVKMATMSPIEQMQYRMAKAYEKKTGKKVLEEKGLSKWLEQNINIEEAKKYWQPTSEEVKKMEAMGWPADLISGTAQALVEMPTYVLAGSVGGRLVQSPFIKLIAKYGKEPVLRAAMELSKRIVGTATSFGGLGAVEKMGAGGTPKEIAEAGLHGVISAPFYEVGGKAGEVLAKPLQKVIGKAVGELVGRVAGGSLGMGTSTYAMTGSLPEAAKGATIGALLPMILHTPESFGRTKESLKAREPKTGIFEKLTQDIIDLPEQKFVEIIKAKNLPEDVKNLFVNMRREVSTLKSEKQQLEAMGIDPVTNKRRIEAYDIMQKKGIGKRPRYIYLADVEGLGAVNEIAGGAQRPEGDVLLRKQSDFAGKIEGIKPIEILRGSGDEFFIAAEGDVPLQRYQNSELDMWTNDPKSNTKKRLGGLYLTAKVELKPGETITQAVERLKAMEGAKQRPEYKNELLASKEEVIEKLKPDPDLIPKKPETQPEREERYNDIAEKLEVPIEERTTIMEYLRKYGAEKAVPALAEIGIKTDMEKLKTLETQAMGSAGFHREAEQGISDAMRQVLGDDGMAKLQELMSTEKGRDIVKKFDQVLNKVERETDPIIDHIKNDLKYYGLQALEGYLDKVKPSGTEPSMRMRHEETLELIKNTDWNAIEKIGLGKDAYSILLAGHKNWAVVESYAKTINYFTAEMLLTRDSIYKNKLKVLNSKLYNDMISKYTTQLLLTTDAARFLEFCKVQKKSEAMRLITEIDNMLKSEGAEGRVTPENIEQIARKLQETNARTPDDIVKVIEPTFMDKILEIRRMMLLNALSTHMVNVGSTAYNVFVQSRIEKGLQATMDMIGTGIKGLTGRQAERRIWGEELTNGRGLKIGIKEGWRKALGVMASEFKPSTIPEGRAYEIQRFRAIKGPIGRWGRTLTFSVLSAEDMFFKEAAYYQFLEQEIIAKYMGALKKRGLKGEALKSELNKIIDKEFAAPDTKLHQKAQDKATEFVFHGKLDPASQAMQKLLVQVPALQIFIPFFKTPVNITKWGWQRLPGLGLIGRNWRDIREGDYRTRVEAWSRQLFGIIGGSIIYGLYKSGWITGLAPRDPDERARYFAAGKKPLAIKNPLTNSYLSLQRWEPLSTVLRPLITGYEAIENTKNKDEKIEFTKVMMDVFKAFTDQTYFSGIKDLFDAIEDPQGRGARIWTNLAVGMSVPTGAGYFARIFDPYLREAGNYFELALSRIPFASRKLEPRLTPLGEEQPLSPLPGRIVPFLSSGEELGKVSKLNKELERLKIDVPYILPSRSVKDKEGNLIKLTAKEYNEIVRDAGGRLKERLMHIVESEGYDKLSDEQKKKRLGNAVKLFYSLYQPRLEKYKKLVLKKEGR